MGNGKNLVNRNILQELCGKKKDSQIYSRLLTITFRKVIVFSRFANQCWLQNFNMEDVVFYNNFAVECKNRFTLVGTNTI